ncbi:uncharacterized protein TNCV_1418431 [Trichonephila clavipes]|nr:uncharacterized protein TNCV_1418431 [Trichonephila clavipes]
MKCNNVSITWYGWFQCVPVMGDIVKWTWNNSPKPPLLRIGKIEKGVNVGRNTGLGSNLREDMDVCKCIEPSRHRGTLNSRRATCPLVRLVAGGGRPLTLPQGVLLQNWGRTELNRTVTRMVLKAKTNDRRTSGPLP